MRYLQLNSLMPDTVITKNSIQWEIRSIQLDSNGYIALSSIVMDFSDKTDNSAPIIIKSNLIERDMFNSEGVLTAFPSNMENVSYFSKNLEFWKLDCSRPRNFIFTLEGLDVTSLSFVNIVLALQ